ncbi:MAG: sulfurtransferase complex subunit TusB [Gammaproteobacteria bacterium]|jgi:sulfur relay protein TusB/DsrH|nr:sulfurtransferase complex subunit TusB [Gammaproteobacteria bacterium]
MTSPAKIGTCLHLVVRASRESLLRCRAQCAAGDTVLFVDAGVMHITGDVPECFTSHAAVVLFSAPDLMARGLGSIALDQAVQTLDDTEFGDLLARHEFCLTWK